MKAFILNSGKAIAIVYKVATSTLSRAIIEQEQPDQLDILTNGTRWGTGQSFEGGYNHRFVRKTDSIGKELLFPVRDPLERFRSACAQVWKGGPLADKTLEELIAEAEGGSNNPHLRPQSWFLGKYSDAASIALYRFPVDLDQMATDAGLSLPLPVVNESEAKPELTAEQEARVLAAYAEDVALFDSILAPGQDYPIPPAPVTTEDVTLAKQTLFSNLKRRLVEPIYLNGVQVNTDPETQQELVGLQTALGRRPNLEVDFKVRTQDGQSVWTRLTSAEIGAMVDAVADNKIALYAAAKAKDEAIDAVTTKDALAAIDLII